MALIAFDARDAFVSMPHGSGIYVRSLLEALQRFPLAGHKLWALTRGGRAPEAWWEQVALPATAAGERRRARALPRFVPAAAPPVSGGRDRS